MEKVEESRMTLVLNEALQPTQKELKNFGVFGDSVREFREHLLHV